MIARRLAAALLVGSSWLACSRAAADATPDGALRQWLDKMDSSVYEPAAAKEAYPLLGPATRANLEERARRTSQAVGRRVEPFEVLAEGRFGVKFHPKAMRASIVGDRATVEVQGDEPAERASVRCVREPAGWRIELELPELPAPPKREVD